MKNKLCDVCKKRKSDGVVTGLKVNEELVNYYWCKDCFVKNHNEGFRYVGPDSGPIPAD